MQALSAEVAIVGGGLGACAAALAAARLGRRVILTEETRWIGGQLTSQAVPPDEHPWIEQFGATASYRELRNRIRKYYRAHLPLTHAARNNPVLNPGNGFVSQLCHDPRVAVAVLDQLLAPHTISGRLLVLRSHRVNKAWTHDDRVAAVAVSCQESGREYVIEAPFFIDGSALGDLLMLAGAEHVTGAESRSETEEPHAAERADPLDQQAVTFCFAMEHLDGEDHTIDKPRDYEFWRNHRPPDWPAPLLSWTVVRPSTLEPIARNLFEGADGYSWWTYRRILDRSNFEEGFATSDVTLVDWPQNDYRRGPLCGVNTAERDKHIEEARQLSLSLLYWLQTGSAQGRWKIRLSGIAHARRCVGGGPDGLALAPTYGLSGVFGAEFTVLEQHIAYPLRRNGPALFADTVGVGCYRIDIHPRTNSAGYLDLGSWPFQIPLGSLIPVRLENLLPGGKNLGTTHITNGAFRVHPVEWNVGEVAGLLATFCLERKVVPRAVRHRAALLEEFQSLLRGNGIELSWPSLSPV